MSESDKKPTSREKWIISIMSGLLFLVIASPFLFSTVNQLTSMVGLKIADARGCPNLIGLLLHALVFTLIARLMMR